MWVKLAKSCGWVVVLNMLTLVYRVPLYGFDNAVNPGYWGNGSGADFIALAGFVALMAFTTVRLRHVWGRSYFHAFAMILLCGIIIVPVTFFILILSIATLAKLL